MAGTIFENSSTPLRDWLTAIFFMVNCKNGTSAREISGLIGVTYKCAWRMCHKIREAMALDNLGELSGIIEIDETFIGGKKKNRTGSKKFNPFTNKATVLGIYQRNGRLKTCLVKNTSKKSLLPPIQARVKTGSTIYSDENSVYKSLPKLGYSHDYVTHKDYQWANFDVTTNRIEGCWSRLKNSIRGVYIHFSQKHMEKYLREFEFRHNNRKKGNLTKFLRVCELVGFEFDDFY